MIVKRKNDKKGSRAKGNKRDLLSMSDLTFGEIEKLLNLAQNIKAGKVRGSHHSLSGKTLGLIFQKPSTRTAASFAVGMNQLGGFPLFLPDRDMQIRRGETLSDTIKTLSRYLDGVMIRANRHSDIEELARHSTIPIINGLTDEEHPCQILGDILTIVEKFRVKRLSELSGLRMTYIGDGNNVAHSWMLAAAILGINLVVSCPERYDPKKDYLRRAEALSKRGKGRVVLERDPQKATEGARVVYTDVWASMGKDEERDQRRNIFAPYQVNTKLLSNVQKDAVVMHCLPAHRGEEISEDVMDGPRSIVFDQAENRLHIQKAILMWLL